MKDFLNEFIRLLGNVPDLVTIAGTPNMPYNMQYNWWYDGIPFNGRSNPKGIPHQKLRPSYSKKNNGDDWYMDFVLHNETGKGDFDEKTKDFLPDTTDCKYKEKGCKFTPFKFSLEDGNAIATN